MLTQPHSPPESKDVSSRFTSWIKHLQFSGAGLRLSFKCIILSRLCSLRKKDPSSLSWQEPRVLGRQIGTVRSGGLMALLGPTMGTSYSWIFSLSLRSVFCLLIFSQILRYSNFSIIMLLCHIAKHLFLYMLVHMQIWVCIVSMDEDE